MGRRLGQPRWEPFGDRMRLATEVLLLLFAPAAFARAGNAMRTWFLPGLVSGLPAGVLMLPRETFFENYFPGWSWWFFVACAFAGMFLASPILSPAQKGEIEEVEKRWEIPSAERLVRSLPTFYQGYACGCVAGGIVIPLTFGALGYF